MKNTFVLKLMEKLEFHEDAIPAMEEVERTLKTKGVDQELEAHITEFMGDVGKLKGILETLDNLAKEIGINNYSLHLWFLLSCTPKLYEKYMENGIDTEIFYNSMHDLKVKSDECMENKGVWGTFVAFWYDRFFNLTRFGLGRFQFEQVEFKADKYVKGDVVINKGDTVYNIHIPSGSPMTNKLMEDSFRRGYEFFEDKLIDGVFVVVCTSWLLYPPIKEFFHDRASNIVEFMNHFDVIEVSDSDEFHDGWRIYGKDWGKPLARLPRDNALRRGFANLLESGKKTGVGFGVKVIEKKPEV